MDVFCFYVGSCSQLSNFLSIHVIVCIVYQNEFIFAYTGQQFLFTLMRFPELFYLSSFSCFLTGLVFPSVFWALSLVDE